MRRSPIHIPASLGFLLFLTLPLSAQVLPLNYYTVRQGLVSNAVRCITQDASGYLWIGTTEGISVFDGIAFRTISILQGLPNSNVNWIEQSKRSPGMMWIATNGGGVCRISGDSVSVIRMTNDQVANRVNMVREDSSGILWCATDRGVYTVSDGRVKPFRPDIDWHEVVAIHRLGPDSMVVLSLKTVSIVSLRTGEFNHVPVTPGADGNFTSAQVVGQGEFWVAATGGQIIQIRNGMIARKLHLGHAVFPITLHLDREGALRVGTYDGVFTVSGDSRSGPVVARYSTEHGLQGGGITALYADSEGNLWFGSFSNGLSVLTDRNVLRFPLETTIPLTNDAGLVLDRDDHAWSVTSGGLLEIWKNARGVWETRRYTAGERGGKSSPTGIAYDGGRNGLWVSFGDNSLRFYAILKGGDGSSRTDVVRTLVPGRDYPGGTLYRFILDSRGRIFISLFETGVIVLDPWHTRPAPQRLTESGDGIPGADIRALLIGRSGALWVGGYISGVVKFRPDHGRWVREKSYTVGNGLSDNSVRVLFEDRGGKIWVGTRYGGITVLDGDSILTLTVREGLISNAVWSIAGDWTGTVWIGTQSGLQSLPGGPHPVFSTVADLTGMIVHTCVVGRSGVVWAYADKGIVMYDAGRLPAPKPSPPIHITGLRVDGAKVPLVSDLELSSWQSNLSVDFTGISFSDPENVRYVYRLADVDEVWQPPSRSRTISFAALKPGEYRLLVKAVTAQGRESAEPAVLRFAITGPFWQRWWFIPLCAALLGGISYGIHRNRLAGLIAVERVRSRIATDLHDDIGSDITQIAILSEVVKVRPGAAENTDRLDKIGTMARRVIAGMSDLVWYIDPGHDRLGDLLNRVRDLASGLLAGQDINFTVDPGPSVMDVALSPEVRKELLLTIKEALTNAVRHACCSWIRMSLRLENRRLTVILEDDGRGIGPPGEREGHGLTNMKQRIEGCGGDFSIGPGSYPGTVIRISVPV